MPDPQPRLHSADRCCRKSSRSPPIPQPGANGMPPVIDETRCAVAPAARLDLSSLMDHRPQPHAANGLTASQLSIRGTRNTLDCLITGTLSLSLSRTKLRLPDAWARRDDPMRRRSDTNCGLRCPSEAASERPTTLGKSKRASKRAGRAEKPDTFQPAFVAGCFPMGDSCVRLTDQSSAMRLTCFM